MPENEDRKPRYSWGSLTDEAAVSQCVNCVHNRGELTDSGRPTCDAFPDGIPEDILENEFLHDKKHPDQQVDEGEDPVTYQPTDGGKNIIETIKSNR